MGKNISLNFIYRLGLGVRMLRVGIGYNGIMDWEHKSNGLTMLNGLSKVYEGLSYMRLDALNLVFF